METLEQLQHATSAIAQEKLHTGDVVAITEHGIAGRAIAQGEVISDIGFVTHDAEPGEAIAILKQGLLDGFSGLIAGANYFLDPYMPGHITTIVPTFRDECIVYVGKAMSDTQLLVDIHRPIRL